MRLWENRHMVPARALIVPVIWFVGSLFFMSLVVCEAVRRLVGEAI